MPRRQRRLRALTCSHVSASPGSPLFSVNAFMSRFRPVRMVVIVIGVSSIMARRWTRAALRRAKAHGGSLAAMRKYSRVLSWVLFLLSLVVSIIGLDHYAEQRGETYRGELEKFIVASTPSGSS